MSFQYILLAEAQKDYEDSLLWYLERSEKAAQNFVNAIDNALKIICSDPKKCKNKYKNYYEFGIKKYPFTIIFIIDEKQPKVIVHSVYHHKRNPKVKYKRKV